MELFLTLHYTRTSKNWHGGYFSLANRVSYRLVSFYVEHVFISDLYFIPCCCTVLAKYYFVYASTNIKLK